jgi:hypothetical protein
MPDALRKIQNPAATHCSRLIPYSTESGWTQGQGLGALGALGAGPSVRCLLGSRNGLAALGGRARRGLRMVLTRFERVN